MVKNFKYIDIFRKYKSSYKYGLIDLSIHIFFMLLVIYLMWYFRNNWINVFLIILLGLLNVKTFIIFHDCGHESYMPNKILNYVIGSITGILSLTPFSWNYEHNIHHKTLGNIENIYKFNFNETITCSLNKYKKLSYIERQLYKLFKFPCIFFGVLPIIHFLFLMRVQAFMLFIYKPLSKRNIIWCIIVDQTINNVGISILFYILYRYSILVYCLISYIISANLGVILFHSQHGFNPPYIVNNIRFNQLESGLKGSSFIKIPKYLKYFSGGIEYHHIHHMTTKIPGYNLQNFHEVAENNNLFNNIITLSMKDCYNNLWLVIYDEEKELYITFKEADKELMSKI